uniref:Metallothionein-like protein n=1 Tax=Lotus japonicus TaxID=34305 RepID=I3S2H6_LOTJA|nr:unknown [Lotus japonicus]
MYIVFIPISSCYAMLFRKGNSYGLTIVETETSYVETVAMDVPAAEHGGNCKCGANCTCVDCTCGY